VTARAVPIYEEVFDVEYPLPKLDTLVAHDFDAGAMENWVCRYLVSCPPLH
jgi:aminopeptidase 2